MNAIKYLIIKLMLQMGRETTFPEMIHHIGESHYLAIHRELNHMIQLGWITQNVRRGERWIFVHWPTLEGMKQYEESGSAYHAFRFSVPVQKSFED